jgi:hypothetical protein
MGDFGAPDFQACLLPYARISGLDSKIEAALTSAGITPTLRLDLSLWNHRRLRNLLLLHPVHLLETSSGKLQVIGGFRLYALASALAVDVPNLVVLALVRKGKLSEARRMEIIEEETFALPALFRRLPGEANAIFQIYFEHFCSNQAGAMLRAHTPAEFFQATGFDRRSVRRPKTRLHAE